MQKNVYEIITERVIEQLAKGVIPWRKPWINGGAVSWKTQKPYRGINTFLLEAGEYATFKQIKEAGGKVKKGEKSHIVVFWNWLEKENEERGEIEKIPYLRYYRVFEINSQVEGLESKRKEIVFDHDPIEKAEEIYKGYINGPDYTFYPGRAVYYPTLDKINCPPLKDFLKAEEYYSTLFHEMVHSTGHKRRLARPGVVTDNVAFGDEVYSKEELVAEMGAAMLCGIAGIDNSTIENSASYIHSWIRNLKDDSRMVVQAAALAQKAADTILGKDESDEE
ncbi:antirestriction protein [Sporosarcina globispora]|uniref:Antirestriction protein n=1 Tax=Sporosarcina globispora TaxID=1459 RepID=A0A0M0G140_SPOGL|nr:zincin-like metallopeptidase domain-containing protein [Sporosarcina globispora]KON83483.1 antirestriction protein [Sporosarcina globispora]